MKRILITGGAGFVGTNLVYSLGKSKKYQIKIFSRKEIKNQKVILGDLMDNSSVDSAFKEIDTIIHLANSKNYPENVGIMENIVNAAKKNKIKKIIFLSSMSARRKFPDEYGKSKILAEKILRESGINYTILRPSIIYGKGSTSFNFLIEKLDKIPFFTPIIGRGKYKIAPVNIKDVIGSIENAIENKKTDKKEYDIVGGEEIMFVNLINQLKKETGINKKNFYVPLWCCYLIAIGFPKIIGKNNLKNITENSEADLENAKRDFNYAPIKFSDGVKDGLL